MEASLSAAGALTGLLVGLTGVGGGALMTPLLLLVIGVAPMTAVGTDLWFAAITKVFASRIHQGHGLIDWPVVRRLWLGSLSTSAITLAWMHLHPIADPNGGFLKSVIAVVIVLTSFGLLLHEQLHALGYRLRTTSAERFKAVQAPLTILSGGVLGILVTLTSIGAGALGAVLLVYLYPLRLTPPRLIATDITHAIPLAVFAGLGHLLIGNVDLTLLGNLLLGSIPGVVTGALLSTRLPHGVLRISLALVLFAIGLKLWSAVST
ncbi:MAG: sulfite exporter TauE/SafE family protein [Dechloromonas sp.]|nr:sulfite exporter TauE/SafE family protein [Dechloromonas sp.]